MVVNLIYDICFILFTLLLEYGFCKSICSFTCFTLIFRFGLCISTCSSTCFILIFKSSFCKTIYRVGISLFTYLTFIFNFGFYRLSFKPIFCNKSFKLDLSSYTIIGKSTQELLIQLQLFSHSTS